MAAGLQIISGRLRRLLGFFIRKYPRNLSDLRQSLRYFLGNDCQVSRCICCGLNAFLCSGVALVGIDVFGIINLRIACTNTLCYLIRNLDIFNNIISELTTSAIVMVVATIV